MAHFNPQSTIDNPQGWIVPIEEIVKHDYDLTAKNPNRLNDAARRTPEELTASILAKEQRIFKEALMERQISLRVPENLLRRLDRRARKNGIRRSELIRRALVAYLQNVEGGWSDYPYERVQSQEGLQTLGSATVLSCCLEFMRPPQVLVPAPDPAQLVGA